MPDKDPAATNGPPSDPALDPAPSLVALHQIDAVCARFEADWQTEQRRRIDTYLDNVDASLRGDLLRELMELEIELRIACGESPCETDYDHFQSEDDRSVVRQVFQDTQVRLGAGEGTQPDGEIDGKTDGNSDGKLGAHGSAVAGIGTRIGPYTLCDCLGEGGMGTVYLAQQHEPIERQVALKVVRPELGSKKFWSVLISNARRWPSWTIPTSRGCWMRAPATKESRTS
jgi:eukaryotic-like serine/threonine-protein kinase